MNRRRGPLRKWRLRGRRGQVAAVATILGLLLVVTFIANYLTATLPGQMSVNDLNHVIQVENQIGRLQALLQAASAADAVGAQFTQPITLGSAGTPPFASADQGTIGPATNGSSLILTSTLTGSLSYTAPTGGIANSGNHPAGCTFATTTITCAGTNYLYYNLSSSTPTPYGITATAGSYVVNITDHGTSSSSPATITVTSQGSDPLDLLIIGNNVTVDLTTTNVAGSVDYVTLDGNNDIVDVTNDESSTVTVYAVGNSDSIDVSSSMALLTLLGTFFGSTDTVTVTTTPTGSTHYVFQIYFNGYSPQTPTQSCPVGNLAATTDTVAGGKTNTGTYHVTYNDTSTATVTPPTPWTATMATPTVTCPFYSLALVPFNLAQSSAAFNVHLSNTYLPTADVAFDQGAVVYAQAGGVPIMIDGPAISGAANAAGAFTSLSIWFPVFTGSFATESGVSTTEIATRLVSVNTIELTPSSASGAANATNIVLTITSPFAAAWAGFFNSTLPFENDWSCAPANGAACNGPYSSGGPLGTVTLTIPTGSLLNTLTIQVATFSVSLI